MHRPSFTEVTKKIIKKERKRKKQFLQLIKSGIQPVGTGYHYMVKVFKKKKETILTTDQKWRSSNGYWLSLYGESI